MNCYSTVAVRELLVASSHALGVNCSCSWLMLLSFADDDVVVVAATQNISFFAD
jgi:hypothetical protein